MHNITLITSIIDTPNLPLSYWHTRSCFSKNERFEQTKKTIDSIRSYIPNSIILLVECSNLTIDESQYFIDNVDIFINMYDLLTENEINNTIYSSSKALGEATMTICGIKHLYTNNIHFDNLFKISGRYFFEPKFNYLQFIDNHNHFFKIENNPNNCLTCFYKLNHKTSFEWLQFLQQNIQTSMMDGKLGYENIFAIFLNGNNSFVHMSSPIGISGFLSITGVEVVI